MRYAQADTMEVPTFDERAKSYISASSFSLARSARKASAIY
jgi:hypothetical protein